MEAQKLGEQATAWALVDAAASEFDPPQIMDERAAPATSQHAASASASPHLTSERDEQAARQKGH